MEKVGVLTYWDATHTPCYQMFNLRKDVLEFAKAMDEVLQQKETERVAKGKFLYTDPKCTLTDLEEAFANKALDLSHQLQRLDAGIGCMEEPEELALHVANYAMMIWQRRKKQEGV